MNRTNIGNNIGILRRQQGITQAELAEAVSVTTDHIDHVENGFSGISLSLLLKICRILRVAPNDILAGEYEIEEENDSSLQTMFTLDNVKPADKILLSHLYYFMRSRA